MRRLARLCALLLVMTVGLCAQTHFDQATDGTYLAAAGPSAPLAWDQPFAGANGLIVISAFADAAVLQPPLVNGTAGFEIGMLPAGNGCSAKALYLFGALGPLVGNNHIVLTPTTTTHVSAVSASYYNMAQSGALAVSVACGHAVTMTAALSGVPSTALVVGGGRNDYQLTAAQTGAIRLSSSWAGQTIGDASADGVASLVWKEPTGQAVDWGMITAAFATTDGEGGGGGGSLPTTPMLVCVLGQSNAVPIVVALRVYLSVVDCGTQGSTAIAAWRPQGPLDPLPRIGAAPIQRVFIWQGESDATAPGVLGYEVALRALIARLRAALGNPTLSVVILSVCPPRTPADPFLEQIRAVQQTVGAEPGNRFFDTTHYPYIPQGQVNGEHLSDYSQLAADLASLP